MTFCLYDDKMTDIMEVFILARIYVTPELGEAIKSIRMQNKITGKSVAEHINKSSTFITRLENASIETIDEDDLWAIFEFICKDELDQNETIERIYDTLKIKYSPEDIQKQVWFENFDTVVRQIPIPEELIDEINKRITNQNIDLSYLLRRINANEDLSEDEVNDEHPYNTWWARDDAPTNATSIKIKLLENEFYDILSKKKDTTSYVFMLAIAFYLIKIERFDELVKFESDADHYSVMSEANNLLSKYKFHTISLREQLLANAKSKEEYNELLSDFEIDNIAVVNSILKSIRYYSDKNIKLANDQLILFNKNINWDIGFMLKLVSLDFNSIADASHSCKSELIKRIELLIEETNQLSHAEKTIETY